jgi:hypothetical protein
MEQEAEYRPPRPAPTATISRPPAPRTRRGAPLPTRRRLREGAADYAYVVMDLRRIGLIAGGLAALLVGLSFIVR